MDINLQENKVTSLTFNPLTEDLRFTQNSIQMKFK